MPEERGRQLDQALDRYWDAVFLGSPAGPDLEDLDPELAAAVRRVHALRAAPSANPVFASRLWEELMHAQSIPTSLDPTGPLVLDTGAAARPRSWARPAPAAVRGRRRRALAQLATAALILLTLLGVYLAFAGRGDERPVVVPAVQATPGAATPAPNPDATAPLVTAAFATEWLPPDPALVGFYRLSFGPGVRTERPAGDFPAGARLDYVVEGAYAVRSDGPLLILRAAAGGTPPPPEEVAPGTEVALGPGDAVVHADDAAAQVFGNAGEGPLVVLFAGVFTAPPPAPPPGIEAAVLGERYRTALAGPVAVAVRRATLAPEGVYPGPGAGELQLVGAESGAGGGASLGQRSDGSAANLGQTALDVWVLTLGPTAPGS